MRACIGHVSCVMLSVIMFAVSWTSTYASTTMRVSVSNGGIQANGDCKYPSMSGDGRFVAFVSSATNLVSGAGNTGDQIYVRDIQTGKTECVSVASDGTIANNKNWSPSISGDGRFVAFASGASNLVAGAPWGQLYVHDRQTGRTECVSVTNDGTFGNSSSWSPSLNWDGRFVAFSSQSSNFGTQYTDLTHALVYIHDGLTGKTECIIADAEQVPPMGGPSISADGRYVAFNMLLYRWQTYVHDRQTGKTECASVANDGTYGDNDTSSWSPSLSADGRFVAFASDANNLVTGVTDYTRVYLHDRFTGNTQMVSTPYNGYVNSSCADEVAISGDGRFVVFGSRDEVVPGVKDGWFQTYLRDVLAKGTECASVAADGTPGNWGGGIPAINADGRFVAFCSCSTNLVEGDLNGCLQIYVHDRGSDGGDPSILTINSLNVTPDTISPGLNVKVSVISIGATSAQIRISGLRRNQPAIPMTWDGTTWTATISGNLASWSQGSSLAVWADVFDGQGNSSSACRTLRVVKGVPTSGSGSPDAVWVDESGGCGILEGRAQILNVGSPLTARLSMSTVVSSLLGVDGPMNLWPAVNWSGRSVRPADCYTLGSLLAQYDRFSPSGGPSYDADFRYVNDKAVFSAHMDGDAFVFTLWDTLANSIAARYGLGNVSTSTLLETFSAFAFLSPVQSARSRFTPWPTTSQLPKAVALASWDLGEFVRNGSERDLLKSALETLFRKVKDNPNYRLPDSAWVKELDKCLTLWTLMKICRDMWIWAIATWDNNPCISFEAYQSTLSNLAVRTSGTGTSGLARDGSTDVAYRLAPPDDHESYDFTLTNSKGAPIWEWRLQFDENEPQPLSTSAPAGWKSEVVWGIDDRYVRWYTEANGGWASEDFGENIIAEGNSISGFCVQTENKLGQCGYSVTDTDLKVGGGMLQMIPTLSAAPPDFAPGNGETTCFTAYLDRPGAVALRIMRDQTNYRTIIDSGPKSSGEFSVDWNGTDSSAKLLADGDYQAVLSVLYTDGDSALITVPLRLSNGIGDTTSPILSITTPTTNSTYATTSPVLAISGTASDNTSVTGVTWMNDRGGNGNCSGTTSWTTKGISLQAGLNIITMTASDATDNKGTATLSVDYTDTSDKKWSGLAMVSCTVIPNSIDPKPVIGFKGNSWYAYQPSSNRYVDYTDHSTWFEPTDTARGRGFWARFDSEVSMPTGEVPAQDHPVSIHLLPGWNLIGQPYLKPVNWNHTSIKVQSAGDAQKALSDSNDVVADFAWGWMQDSVNPNTGSYYLISDPSVIPGGISTLSPWHAYWVKAYKECDLILPPP